MRSRQLFLNPEPAWNRVDFRTSIPFSLKPAADFPSVFSGDFSPRPDRLAGDTGGPYRYPVSLTSLSIANDLAPGGGQTGYYFHYVSIGWKSAGESKTVPPRWRMQRSKAMLAAMSDNDSARAGGAPILGPRNLAWQVATWFGAGLMPKAPGTWGALAAIPFAYGIQHLAGPVGLFAAACVLCALGVWAAEEFRRHAGTKDPRAIVVDEVAGQWLTLVPAGDDMLFYAAGFVLFRFFDIWKPWPVSWADRRVEGGWGIMLDDMIAGAYSACVLGLGMALVARAT